MSLGLERRTQIVQERVDKVIELIAAGLKRKAIHEWIEKNTDWNVSRATIDGLIKKARADISRMAHLNRKHYLTDAILSLKFLYAKSLEAGNFKMALETLKTQIELLDLNTTAKKINDPRPVSPPDDLLLED